MLSTLIVTLATLATPPAPVNTEITVETLLAEMTDRTAVAQFPSPAYTCAQFSSYDRASTSPDDQSTWFANGDAGHFLRVEERDGRTEHVLMDAAGPGAVVRIWSANPAGTLRVYLDDATVPVIEAPMQELLGGRGIVPGPLARDSARGWNLFLPIPYAKRCVMTSDAGGFYYHVNYRTYEAGTRIRTLTRGRLADAQASIAQAVERLSHRPLVRGRPTSWAFIRPGETFTLDLPEAGPRGSAVKRLFVGVDAPDLEAALRSTVLIGTFDQERTIWCPLGDFFGSGVGLNPYNDWYRTVDPTGVMTSRWVMPYEASGSFTFVNLSSGPIRVHAATEVEPWTWDDRSMHFHARWKHEHPIDALGGAGTIDWNYATIRGRGVYVGDNLAVMNPVEAWWGEGDEKIYVDDEAFPSHFGTGTEDYYGYAWCSNLPFSHPFHSQTRCDGFKHGNNWGHSCVTRVRSLDAIPFTSSFRLDMEVWHWKATPVGYAATTYFYARPCVGVNIEPDPGSAAAPIVQPPPLPPPFRLPLAVEGEDLTIVASSPDLRTVRQDMRGFASRTWSGEAHLWVQARAPGDFVEFEIPVPEFAGHRLALVLTRSWDYGIVRVRLNGEIVGSDMDLFSGGEGQVRPTGAVGLGIHSPVDAARPVYRLRLEVIGSNDRSLGGGHFFGVDAVIVEPTQ